MTRYWGDQNPFTGESGTGLPGTGPGPDEMNLLQRVRDGLLREPAESSSDDEEGAAA